MEKKKTTAIKTMETSKLGYGFTKRMYTSAVEAQQKGLPVVWWLGSGDCSTQLLSRAIEDMLGFVPIYPENYAAAVAAKRAAYPFLQTSEADGFSSLICGYAQVSIGYACRMAVTGDIPPDAPMGGMPQPAAMVGSTHLCDARYKWFQALGRYLDVPRYCFDNSRIPVTVDFTSDTQHYINYLAEELRDCVAFLEKLSAKKVDPDRLNEFIDIALETRRLWYESYQLRKAVPCPMSSPDMWACMVPPFWWLGTKGALDFTQKLYDELKDRVGNKIGAIPHERFRLAFAGLPPWHTLELFDYLANKGAISVIETQIYFPGPPPPIPPNITDPYERMARWHFWWWTETHLRARGESEHWCNQRYLEWVKEYQLDGVLLHTHITCRSNCLGQAHLRDILWKHAQVPCLTIQSDIVDARTFSEAQTKMAIDNFIETMEHYQETRRQKRE